MLLTADGAEKVVSQDGIDGAPVANLVPRKKRRRFKGKPSGDQQLQQKVETFLGSPLLQCLDDDEALSSNNSVLVGGSDLNRAVQEIAQAYADGTQPLKPQTVGFASNESTSEYDVDINHDEECNDTESCTWMAVDTYAAGLQKQGASRGKKPVGVRKKAGFGIPDFLDFDRVWYRKEASFCPDREGRKFSLACTIYSVSDINDVKQTFRVKYRLLCNVAITEKDFDRHMSMEDCKNWKPTFVPHVKPMNAAKEIKWIHLRGSVGETYSLQVAFNDNDKSWVAHFEMDCETVFLVPFDVHYCPYDVQELKMIFRVETTRQSFNRPRHWSEWHWEAPWTAARWALTHPPQGDYALSRHWIYLERDARHGSPNRDLDQFRIVLLARRNWLFFFWRVMFILFIINGVVLAVFLFKSFDEMLLFASIMLLACVTFLFISYDMVPHVAYMTMLDYYVYGSFFFISSVTMEVCFTKILADADYITWEEAGTVRNWMGAANVLLLTIVNIFWVVASCRAYFHEQHRFDALLREEHSVARMASWRKQMPVQTSQGAASMTRIRRMLQSVITGHGAQEKGK